MNDNWKAKIKRALKIAQPYLIGVAVGAAVVVGGGILYGRKLVSDKNQGTLVKLLGEAAKEYFDNNQSSMSPAMVDIQHRLLKNPGHVVINPTKDKMYTLIGGLLTAVTGDYNHMTAEDVNKYYLASWEDGFSHGGKNLVQVFMTKISSRFTDDVPELAAS